MTSCSTRSQIERRPRAPVPCSCASWAMARRASFFELERGIFELEHLRVLLHEGVLRLGEDADKVVLGQLVQRRDHRDAADELGDHAELVQVLGKHLRQQLSLGVLLALGQLGREAQPALAHALGHDVGQAHERPAQDEQDVRRVDVDEFLLGCLRPPCGGPEASVPSTSFRSACCTPSPETSRVIEGLSPLRAILSISSMKTMPISARGISNRRH